MKNDVIIEAENAEKSVSYRNRVADMLKTQIGMRPAEKKMKSLTAEKENVLHAMNMRFFSTLEGEVLQNVLQAFKYR